MARRSRPIDARKDGGVKEKRCTLPKAERILLGKDLPTFGLFPRELAARKRRRASGTEDVR